MAAAGDARHGWHASPAHQGRARVGGSLPLGVHDHCCQTTAGGKVGAMQRCRLVMHRMGWGHIRCPFFFFHCMGVVIPTALHAHHNTLPPQPNSTNTHPHLRRAGAHPITDWSDLLQPQLQRKVACTDAPREYIGLALKTLGLPLNASARDMRAAGLSESDLVDAVRRVRKQVCGTGVVGRGCCGRVHVCVAWHVRCMPWRRVVHV